MSEQIISLYKSIYVNIPHIYRGEFSKKLRHENLGRLNFMSICLLLLTPFMVYAHGQLVEHQYCSKNHFYCDTLFTAHYKFLFFFQFSFIYQFLELHLLLLNFFPEILFFLRLGQFFSPLFLLHLNDMRQPSMQLA